VKNTGWEDATFVSKIWYPGGEYVIGMKTVPAGETFALDIRTLRDEGIKDIHENKLPSAASTGQILWQWRSGPKLVGRVRNVSISKGLANNMSCPTCGCACPNTPSIALSPSSVSGPIGISFQFIVWQTDDNPSACYGPFPYQVAADDWGSSDTSVATVNSSGVANLVGAGTANISATKFVENLIQDPNWTFEVGFECWPCISQNAVVHADADVTSRPVITGPNNVWWFNGVTPSGFATQVTLTSNAGSGTTWAVTAGANKVSLSSTTGSSITVTSSGSAFSSTLGDVQITATANGQSSLAFQMTTRKPLLLFSLGPTVDTGVSNNNCFASGTDGWASTVSYEILDNLAQTVSNAGINEHFGNETNVVQNDWPVPPEFGANAPDGRFDDFLCVTGSLSPDPLAPQSPLSTQVIDRIVQEWRVGSTGVIGHNHSGVRVQTNDLTRFRDHARHQNIQQGP
jgi:hypothetical protein